jgi:hypothetical protein
LMPVNVRLARTGTVVASIVETPMPGMHRFAATGPTQRPDGPLHAARVA